ncbi:galanin receptor 2b-like [Amphiura filiformis]|uniref:galanin receptor 2b-like n=1 Tax=Amphiura filiformis TaxID=82378 RepID=UPI003B223088
MDNTTTSDFSISTPRNHGLLNLNIVNVFHLVIGVIGILCNTLSIVIILKIPVSKSSRVNLFILNQSIVDLTSSMFLIIFALSLETSQYIGVLGEFLCRFWSPGSHKFLFVTFAISTFNLTAMSIERYTAVIHHLNYKKLFTRRNTVFIIVSVYILGPLAQFIPILKLNVIDAKCEVKASWSSVKNSIVGTFLFIWEFLIPCLVMTYAYVMIIRKLRSSSVQPLGNDPNRASPTNADTSGSSSAVTAASQNIPNQIRHKNITITVFILFIVYIICWSPNQFTFLQFNLGGPLDFSGGWYHFTVFLAFCNTFSNTFVYAFKQRHFQNVLKNVLCRRAEEIHEVSTSTSGGS